MTNYYVYVALRSDDIDALGAMYEAIYNELYKTGKISFPNWYEGIGYAEEVAVTPKDRAEFEEDYKGTAAKGYCHAITFEDTVSEEIKNDILGTLGVSANERGWEEYRNFDAYDRIRNGVSIEMTVQPIGYEEDEVTA